MNKITKATVKSFIKKNFNNLHINVKSSFDGMVDGCVSNHEGFKKIINTNDNVEHTCGIQDAWFVNHSRDYFSIHDTDTHFGYQVMNSCGVFILAILK